ncbi:MAG: YegP family protein [Actinomycetales bacterium]
MAGVYKTSEVYKRSDGLYAFRIKSANGQIVATDGNQGYSTRASAETIASNITKGEYDGPITDL